ncbi:aspartate aminotransferase, partial [Bifidobacteriaceae bacterium NR021]
MAQNFADELKKAMKRKGYKQIDVIELAAKSGHKLGKSQLSQYLSGKTEPRKDVRNMLDEILGISSDGIKSGHSCAKIEQNCQSAEEPQLNQPQLTETELSQTLKHRNFNKSTKLEHVLYDVRGPVVEEANRMEANGTHILKLNIGNPAPFGFRAPDEVIYDMQQQLIDCEGYSDSRGLFSARKAIMQYDQLKGIPGVQMEDIYTGNGVSELINLSMQALLDCGDEILIPSPDYPLWTACASLAGGTPVHYMCDEKSH